MGRGNKGIPKTLFIVRKPARPLHRLFEKDEKIIGNLLGIKLDFGLYIETVLTKIQEGDTDYAGMLPNQIDLPKKGAKTLAA